MSIELDYEIKITCGDCKKLLNEEHFDPLCDDCLNKNIIFHFKEAMIEASFDKEYLWKNKAIYAGWDTEKEKEIFMKGIKHGYMTGLFWIAQYWEDELLPLWEEINEKVL